MYNSQFSLRVTLNLNPAKWWQCSNKSGELVYNVATSQVKCSDIPQGWIKEKLRTAGWLISIHVKSESFPITGCISGIRGFWDNSNIYSIGQNKENKLGWKCHTQDLSWGRFQNISEIIRGLKIQNGRQGAPKWPTGSGKGSNPRLLGALINFC